MEILVPRALVLSVWLPIKASISVLTPWSHVYVHIHICMQSQKGMQKNSLNNLTDINSNRNQDADYGINIGADIIPPPPPPCPHPRPKKNVKWNTVQDGNSG